MRVEGSMLVPDTFEGIQLEVEWFIDGESVATDGPELQLPALEPGEVQELDIRLRVRDGNAKVRTGRDTMWETAEARIRLSASTP